MTFPCRVIHKKNIYTSINQCLFRQDKCMHQLFSKFYTSLKIHDYENMHIKDACNCLIDFIPILI